MAQEYSAWDDPRGEMLHVWSVADRRRVGSLDDLRHGMRTLEFSPDGRFLSASSSDGWIQTWSVAKRTKHRQLRATGAEVEAVAVAPDGGTLATGDAEGSIHLWHSVTGQRARILKGHGKGIRGLAYSPDGQLLASSDFDGSVRLWEVTSGRELRHLPGEPVSRLNRWGEPSGPAPAWGIAFSPDGKLLAAASTDAVRVWETETGHRRFKLPNHFAVRRVAFTPDGRHLLSTAGQIGHGRAEGDLRLWQVSDGKEVARFPRLRSEAADSFWDLAFPTRPTPGQPKWIAARTMDEIVVWDQEARRELRALVLPGPINHLATLAGNATGELLAAGHWDGQLVLWEPGTGRLLDRAAAHLGRVTSAAFLPDGQHLLTAGQDTTVRLWRIRDRQLVPLCNLHAFRDGEWAVLDIAGRYDASRSGNVPALHGVSGLKAVDLLHLRERCYEPGLLATYLRLGERSPK